MKLILASQSLRRQAILHEMGYDFEVIPSDAQETFDSQLDLDAALEQVALSKAKTVQKDHPEDMILAADTIVVQNGRIMGKPKDAGEAAEMLLDLSGSWHEVKTGVCLLTPRFEITFTDTARVHFKPLTDQEILEYANSGKPLDKAGAYGIQEVDFVDELIGDYHTVVGLPIKDVAMVMDLLKLIESPQIPDYFF